MGTYFYLLILLSLFLATIITYHYVTLVTYGLPVSQIETTSLNCEEAIKKPLISQRLIIRLHILNTLTTFNVIFICSADVLSPTLCGLFLFFRNAFIQFFPELIWLIKTLRCHDISPLKSPAILRGSDL